MFACNNGYKMEDVELIEFKYQCKPSLMNQKGLLNDFTKVHYDTLLIKEIHTIDKISEVKLYCLLNCSKLYKFKGILTEKNNTIYLNISKEQIENSQVADETCACASEVTLKLKNLGSKSVYFVYTKDLL